MNKINVEIMKQLQENLELSGLRARTIKDYTRCVKIFLEDIKKESIKKIENEDARIFLLKLKEKKLTYRTINNYRSALKYLFLAVLEKPWNDKKIGYLKGYKPIPIILSKKEVLEILKNVKSEFHRLILATIYSAGLRLGEAANLRVTDLDSERMKIHIRQSKSGRARMVVLSEKILVYLRKYFKEHWLKRFGKWEKDDLLFCEYSKNTPFNTKKLADIYKKAACEAKIKKKLTIHSLRHAYATHSFENGTDIYKLKENLGHKSLRSTCIYIHLSNTSNGSKSPFDDN